MRESNSFSGSPSVGSKNLLESDPPKSGFSVRERTGPHASLRPALFIIRPPPRGDLRSLLTISIRKTSNLGSQLPEPSLMFTSTCPFTNQISKGLGPFVQIHLLNTCCQHHLSTGGETGNGYPIKKSIEHHFPVTFLPLSCDYR